DRSRARAPSSRARADPVRRSKRCASYVRPRGLALLFEADDDDVDARSEAHEAVEDGADEARTPRGDARATEHRVRDGTIARELRERFRHVGPLEAHDLGTELLRERDVVGERTKRRRIDALDGLARPPDVDDEPNAVRPSREPRPAS